VEGFVPASADTGADGNPGAVGDGAAGPSQMCETPPQRAMSFQIGPTGGTLGKVTFDAGLL
jgi:hypothetical protein